MKRFLLVFLSFLTLQSLAAGEEKTKMKHQTPTFMDIPIDGSKYRFENKLLNKGFQWGYSGLEGNFFGQYVKILVFTNDDSHKVCAVRVKFEKKSDHAFLNLFNELFGSFQQTGRYSLTYGSNLSKPEFDSLLRDPENIFDDGTIFARGARFEARSLSMPLVILISFVFTYDTDSLEPTGYALFVDYINTDNYEDISEDL